MPDTFGYLLCFKLCWHNQRGPRAYRHITYKINFKRYRTKQTIQIQQYKSNTLKKEKSKLADYIEIYATHV